MMRPVDRLWIGRKIILAAGDAVLFCVSVGVVFMLRDPTWVSAALLAPFFPVLCFCLITAYAAGLYELRIIRDFVALVSGLLGSCITCCVFGATYFYLLAPQLRFAPKVTLLIIVAGTHLGMLIWRRAVLSATGFSVVDLKIVVLGDDSYREYLGKSFGRRSFEEFNMVADVAADVDLVVVDRRWTDRNPVEARRVLAAAIGRLIPIVSVDEFHESLFGKVSPEHANDLAWALDHVLSRSGSLYFKAKRLLDLTAAVVLLLILAVPMLLVAVVIRLVDHVSPFYRQSRIGYLGRTFVLWKFRTMRHDAEHEGPFIPTPAGRDLRVTRVGRALRRLRIDELPQLWNVLKGDMSLVGPRPEWIKEVEVLEKTIPTYRLRYLVPPGITGWAQVYFRATNNPLDSVEKHNYDLYYLKHFSLALDFSIMLKTTKRVFVKDARTLTIPAPRPLDATSDPDAALDIASIVGRG
jgi:lipopolysaccharide/colanic/teichoic acid biosynthesis glycosyltransferase